MLPEAIKAKALLKLAREISQHKAGYSALIVDLSGVPAIRNRVLFRAFARYLEEHALERAVRVHPLAMNVVVLLVPTDDRPQVVRRIEELNDFLLSQRHGRVQLVHYDLENSPDRFVAYCTRLMEQAPAPAPDRSVPITDPAPPDIASLDRMIGIQGSIGQADLTLQIRSQTIWQLEKDQPPAAFAEEFWVSIAAIEQITGQFIHSDAWLFGRSTELLDQRMLSHLSKEPPVTALRLFINLNPSSIVGGGFRKLVANLPAEQLRRLTVETALLDWRRSADVAGRILDQLQRMGVGLALDGIRAQDIATLTPEELAAADYLKLDAVAQDDAELDKALAGLAPETAAKVVLCHCETTAQIGIGIKHGILLYQGSHLAGFLDNPAEIEALLGATAAEASVQAVKTAYLPEG